MVALAISAMAVTALVPAANVAQPAAAFPDLVTRKRKSEQERLFSPETAARKP